MNLVVSFLGECGEWWTGGETLNPDTTVEDSWFWNLSNRTEPMSYRSWYGREPNNAHGIGEKYLSMWTPTAQYVSADFQWFDVLAKSGCALCEFDREY